MRDLEAFSKKENAERKAETENINKILNAENDKRMKEAQALKDKMEKEKKELQAYLEQVWPFALDRGTEDGSTDVVPQILYGPYLILGVFGSCMF